ncbi:MAG: YicC family protein [Bacteroidales bacterium]|nr:YicC family protein [Bacteroidales bacterium]
MVYSMTGYGKAEVALAAGKLSIEIRSLNGKGTDISIKSPLIPKEKELPLRQKIAEALVRGTIDVFVNLEAAGSDNVKAINAAAVKEYYSQIKALRGELPGFAVGSTDVSDRMNNELLAAILRFPDVLDSHKADVIDESNWPEVEAGFDRALDALKEYRAKEGEALVKDVTGRIHNILALEDEVESHEAERISTIKEKILAAAEDLHLRLDAERFEQEMIFYLEKYDINEEKVRLRQHCKYFLDTISNEPCPGKKLGFIIQEMGREINTTGSKANHALIQKAVVRMKDELEKIREQSLNIL